MTIKHQNKNISAEKQYVITDVQDNPNGILTFTLSNLYSNTTDTLQIDLSKHKLTLTKVTQSELNRLKNSQDEIDIKNRESHIYLVQKNTNDEGIYQEFIWVDNDFEIVGSTDINLEPYFLKGNVYNGLDYDQNNNTKALSAYQGYLLNQNKINKSDIVTNLTTDNDNKVLSAKQGKLLQDNKLNKNQTSYKGKNVVVDNNSGEITFEDKPTIPKASTTTPLSDSTNGSIGNSDKWAKADHVHPKSNLYAESGHNHDNTYIKLSNTTGLVKNDGTIDTTTYSTASHTHGNLQTNGVIGTSNNANKNVITDANGKITTENKPTIPTKTSDLTNDGDGSNVFVKDNDSRLTNSRTPTSHSHGNITNNGRVTVDYDTIILGPALIADNNDDGTLKTGLLSNTYISDRSSLQNINHSLDGNETSQENVNILIDAKIGDISGALNNKINKSSTKGLVKNDGSIDTTSYLSSLPSHTHTKSEITNFTHTHSISDVDTLQTALNGKANTSHTHNDLYYTKSEVDNMNLGSGSSGEVDLSNYIRKSSTSGLVKNDGSIDTTSYLSSLPNHTHKKSEITDFPAIPDVSNYIKKSSTSGLVKNDGSIDTTSYLSSLPNHTHKKSEITDFPAIPDVSNYIKKSSTSGLVKNDGSIDTTNYLSSLPSHTHTKSEITNFTHTHSISDVDTLQTALNGKANTSHTHNEYVTNQELYDNIPIDYVITAKDSTFTESVSPFIVGEDYYFTIMAVQTSSIGVTIMSIPINDIRCEIVHSGAVADLTPVTSDENTVTFKFTPTEQKGHILKVYFLGTPVATYTFDAIIDSDWQEVTFKSGYSKYSASTSVYIRRKGDFVELTGVWKPTSTKSASNNPVPFASIPTELKPTKSMNIICPGQGKNTYMLTVDGDGLLKWSRYGTTTSIDLADGHFGSVHCTWII